MVGSVGASKHFDEDSELFDLLSSEMNEKVSNISSRKLMSISQLSPLSLNIMFGKKKRVALLSVILGLFEEHPKLLRLLKRLELAAKHSIYHTLLQIFAPKDNDTIHRLHLIIETNSIRFNTSSDVLAIPYPDPNVEIAEQDLRPIFIKMKDIISGKSSIDPARYLILVMSNLMIHQQSIQLPKKKCLTGLIEDESHEPSVERRRLRHQKQRSQSRPNSLIQVRPCAPSQPKPARLERPYFRVVRKACPSNSFDSLSRPSPRPMSKPIKLPSMFSSEKDSFPKSSEADADFGSSKEKLIWSLKQTNIKLFGRSSPSPKNARKKIKSSHKIVVGDSQQPIIPRKVWPCFIFKKGKSSGIMR